MSLFQAEQKSGRTLWCSSYVVASTYGTFAVRTPSEKCNAVMLDFTRREAGRVCGNHVPVHVIEPVREAVAIDYPPICVTGCLDSSPIRSEMHSSALTIVWFQQEPWPVPDAAALAVLETLDWEGLALDGLM